MRKFKILVWYISVVINLILFITTLYTKNIWMAVCTFAVAILLSSKTAYIPLPEIYHKLMITSRFRSKKR
jgi:hypothetical protein